MKVYSYKMKVFCYKMKVFCYKIGTMGGPEAWGPLGEPGGGSPGEPGGVAHKSIGLICLTLFIFEYPTNNQSFGATGNAQKKIRLDLQQFQP